MLPLIIPAVILASFAVVTSFVSSVFFAGVAAVTSIFVILGSLGAIAVVCAPFVLMACSAVTLFLVGMAIICGFFVAAVAMICGVFVTAVAVICGALVTIASVVAAHFLGIINLAPVVVGLMAIVTKLRVLGVEVAAKAALTGSSVTAAMAEHLRVEKKRGRFELATERERFYLD